MRPRTHGGPQPSTRLRLSGSKPRVSRPRNEHFKRTCAADLNPNMARTHQLIAPLCTSLKSKSVDGEGEGPCVCVCVQRLFFCESPGETGNAMKQPNLGSWGSKYELQCLVLSGLWTSNIWSWGSKYELQCPVTYITQMCFGRRLA